MGQITITRKLSLICIHAYILYLSKSEVLTYLLTYLTSLEFLSRIAVKSNRPNVASLNDTLSTF